MATTTFVDKETVIEADWLNAVDALVYDIFGGVTSLVDAKNVLGLGTSATGLTITDDFHLLADNKTLNIGAGDDISIYHDGTDSFIDNKTGDLNIRSLDTAQPVNIYARRADSTIDVLATFSDGIATLYYQGSSKITTSSVGASVSGYLQSNQSTNTPNFIGYRNNTGADGPALYLWHHTDSTLNADDSAGIIKWQVSDATPRSATDIGSIEVTLPTETAGSEDGRMTLSVADGGSLSPIMYLNTNGVDILSPGFETSGINVNGVTYTSSMRVNDIGGNNAAQFIIHRHSTTWQPLILGARTNDDTTSHTAVTAGQSVFSIFGAGYTGTHYDLFAQIDMLVSSSGTVSSTSAPGKMIFKVSADGTQVPAAVLTLDEDKSATFTGNIAVSGTVDGRDIATDGTKLDGIEALADVTDATNVAAAGAAMLSAANVFTNNNVIIDGKYLRLGTGSDMGLIHTGAAGYIQNTTGNTYIEAANASAVVQINAYDSVGANHTCALFGGAIPGVNLYYDGAIKLYTATDGAVVQTTGGAAHLILYRPEAHGNTSIGYIDFAGYDSTPSFQNYARIQGIVTDNTAGSEDSYIQFATMLGGTLTNTVSIRGNGFLVQDNMFGLFGDSSDLQILHSGTYSQIKNLTGDLYLDESVNSGVGHLRGKNSVGTTKECLAWGAAIPYVSLFYDGELRANTDTHGMTFQHNNDAAILQLRRNQNHGSAADVGRITFSGQDSATSYEVYAQIKAIASDNTATSEDSEFRFLNVTNGTLTENMRVDANATAGNTRLSIWDVDNATMERVSVGAANSGGTGYKVLRIPN